jgi:transposase InsO family protein
VMCSSAHAPSGFEKRWAGRDVAVHRLPEGTLRHRARHDMPGVGGVAVVVLQMARRPVTTARSPQGAHRKHRAAVAVHKGKYGSPRIYADFRDEGWSISVNTVAAIMREQGMVARPKRHRRHTTRPGKGRWRAPDLVKRKFAAQQLNGKWYGDGTEVETDEGKLQVDSVLETLL